MAAASPYFERAFFGSFNEATPGSTLTLDAKEIAPQLLEAMVKYIYGASYASLFNTPPVRSGHCAAPDQLSCAVRQGIAVPVDDYDDMDEDGEHTDDDNSINDSDNDEDDDGQEGEIHVRSAAQACDIFLPHLGMYHLAERFQYSVLRDAALAKLTALARVLDDTCATTWSFPALMACFEAILGKRDGTAKSWLLSSKGGERLSSTSRRVLCSVVSGAGSEDHRLFALAKVAFLCNIAVIRGATDEEQEALFREWPVMGTWSLNHAL